MELYGEIQGAGALVLTVEDYRNIPILYPLPEIRKEFRMLKNFISRETYRIVNVAEQGPLEFEQNDRKELDDIILKELGFKDKEERQMIQNEIYDWLKSHVLFRLCKPKRAPPSVAESIRKKRVQTDLREFQ